MVYFLLFSLLVFLDQYTKYLTVNYLTDNSITIIKNFFYLTYVENRGAAWGIFSDNRWFLLIVTIIALIVVFCFLKKGVKENGHSLYINSLFLIFTGAFGNFTDRLFKGYVVDMLDFYIFGYDYPVFNFADILIVVGTILLCVYIVFYSDKEKKKVANNEK